MFLAYFLAAVESIFPDAVRETKTILNAAELPLLNVLARSLINELDQIEKNSILVLYDYHVIHDKKELFDPEYVGKLYKLGYWLVKSGYPWHKGPPGFETQ